MAYFVCYNETNIRHLRSLSLIAKFTTVQYPSQLHPAASTKYYDNRAKQNNRHSPIVCVDPARKYDKRKIHLHLPATAMLRLVGNNKSRINETLRIKPLLYKAVDTITVTKYCYVSSPINSIFRLRHPASPPNLGVRFSSSYPHRSFFLKYFPRHNIKLKRKKNLQKNINRFVYTRVPSSFLSCFHSVRNLFDIWSRPPPPRRIKLAKVKLKQRNRKKKRMNFR